MENFKAGVGLSLIGLGCTAGWNLGNKLADKMFGEEDVKFIKKGLVLGLCATAGLMLGTVLSAKLNKEA
jgi:hypothetical protein